MKWSDKHILMAEAFVLMIVILLLDFWVLAADIELDSFSSAIMGALNAAFATLLGYYWGSSKGSADKTEMGVKP